jgi:hypothetical protein
MATVYDQPKTTYSDTGPDIRVISDVINLIDPMDTPFIAAIGGLDAGRSKLKVNENGTKVEILEDEAESLLGTASHSTTIATTATNWTVVDASIFRDGMVVLMDAEYVVIKDADATANTVTVYARNYGGTNATHATNVSMEIVGMARLEGDDTDYGGLNALTIPYNYTGIFEDGLKITGTQDKIGQWGMPNLWEYQATKKLPRLLQLIEKSCFHGVRAAGTATTPRSFGGLGTFITNNTTSTSGAVNKMMVDDLAEAIYLDGGNPDLFVCNPGTARDLRGILDTSSFVNLTQDNNEFGMKSVQAINTQWGVMKIVQSRFCPVSKAWMLDSRKVGLYTLRPFGWKPMGDTGDSRKGLLVGEVTLLVANDKAHGIMTGITT